MPKARLLARQRPDPPTKTDPTTTADASSDFDDIVSAISTTGGLYPAVLEARAKLQREHPAGYGLTLIAHEVWPADASTKATAWYQRAARSGYPSARSALARLLAGQAVTDDAQ